MREPGNTRCPYSFYSVTVSKFADVEVTNGNHLGQPPEKLDAPHGGGGAGIPHGVRQATPVGHTGTPWIQPRPNPPQSHQPSVPVVYSSRGPPPYIPPPQSEPEQVAPPQYPFPHHQPTVDSTHHGVAALPSALFPTQNITQSTVATSNPSVQAQSTKTADIPPTPAQRHVPFQFKRFRSSPSEKTETVKRYRSC